MWLVSVVVAEVDDESEPEEEPEELEAEVDDELADDDELGPSLSEVVFTSPHAASASPRVSPSAASRLSRMVAQGAWQKGQVVVPSKT